MAYVHITIKKTDRLPAYTEPKHEINSGATNQVYIVYNCLQEAPTLPKGSINLEVCRGLPIGPML